MSSEESCRTCRYADPTIGDDAVPYVACRRYPPLPIVVDGEPVEVFPTATEADWCGEWRPGDSDPD